MSPVCPSIRPSVRLSVCLSVTLVDCDHIGWNSSKLISALVSLGCSLFATPTWRVCSKGNTLKFGPKVIHPLLIWASETFHHHRPIIDISGRRRNSSMPRSWWSQYQIFSVIELHRLIPPHLVQSCFKLLWKRFPTTCEGRDVHYVWWRGI